MSKIPFRLPACDRPATTRVELYGTAPDGSSSSLEACAYACEQHEADVVAAAWGADLNAYRVDVAPGMQRKCGHLHIFPTGGLGGGAK